LPSDVNAMPLSIKRSREALQDQTEIWLSIAEDNLRAADGVYDRINDAIRMLADHPEAGRLREELRPGLRCLPVGSYLIFYSLGRGTLDVRRIMHGARDITPDTFRD
jgi:toxin ParE1/3/4